MRNDSGNGIVAHFTYNTLDRSSLVYRVKDQKVGEGAYAVVYRGTLPTNLYDTRLSVWQVVNGLLAER